MMGAEPLVSIILCVRNGLPHVRDAVASVRRLTYRNFELVVQDGASTDGTLEYLRSIDDLPVAVTSSHDSGIGQAFNRALQRCRGEIIGSVDADNRLHPGALTTVVQRFAEHRAAAVVYGGCDMIAEDGSFIHTWTAPDFDLLGLIDGSVVPPFATSFFSRRACGDALAFDETLPTVADFDLWLRLASLPIVRVFDVLADVRVGPQSSTWTADSYERHCHFKLAALRRFVAGGGRDLLVSKIVERAEAGIYLWALDSMVVIGATQDYIDRYFQLGLDTDLRSERFRRIVNAAHPAMPPQHPRRDDVLALGIEYLRKGEPAAALTYFELLQSWNVPAPTLQEVSVYRTLPFAAQLEICDELLSSAGRDEHRRNQALADLRQTLHAEMHHDVLEMNKREQQAAQVIGGLKTEIDQHLKRCEHLQASVQARDEIIDGLRARLPGNRIRRFFGMAPAQ